LLSEAKSKAVATQLKIDTFLSSEPLLSSLYRKLSPLSNAVSLEALNDQAQQNQLLHESLHIVKLQRDRIAAEMQRCLWRSVHILSQKGYLEKMSAQGVWQVRGLN